MIESSYARTRNGMKNSIVAVTFKILFLIVGFFGRRVFLEALGTEVMGLGQMAASLLDFLNILELGIGSAIAVTLYKPLFDKDFGSVREICALQGWLYGRIAAAIIAVSIILMCFFPAIFSKTDLPLWYAYVCFIEHLYSALLGYYVNYRVMVLYANQKQYVVQISYDSVMILSTIVQMIAVRTMPGNPFLWYVCIDIAATSIASFTVNRAINRSCPYLNEKVSNRRQLLKKYPEILSKVKQLFIHRIGGFIILRSSTFIIYAYASLTMITLYGNYTVLTNSLVSLIDALFASLAAGIGNLAAEKNEKLTMKVFRELVSVRFLILGVCCICLWLLSQKFIPIWLGEQYLLEDRTLLLIIVLFFLTGLRSLFESYVCAYGLFKDVWCPFVEAAINVSASIVLGKFYGLNGVLMGLIISYLFIDIWKPIFIFKNGFHKKFSFFVMLTAKHLAITGAVAAIMLTAAGRVSFYPDNLLSFIIYASIVFIVSASVMFALLYATESGIRTFTSRIFHTLARR